MRPLGRRAPRFDFLIIGAQKSGTTSLWRYLEDNPAIRMPPQKEATFFTEAGYPHDLGRYMRALFKDAPHGVRLGDCSPTYMLGSGPVDVAEVAARIHATVPAVRLVALLRDPVGRARSAHRMGQAVNGDTRSFEVAVRDQLLPEALERAREHPTPTGTYVVGGEYGRILSAYLDRFARDQLHVAFTADLERDPLAIVEAVCGHIGVAPHRPQHLGRRFHPGGGTRVDAEAAADLNAYLARHVWPRMRHPRQHQDAFELWFRLWNTVPAEVPEDPIDPDIEASLRAHFAEDRRMLEALVDRPLPWPAVPR